MSCRLLWRSKRQARTQASWAVDWLIGWQLNGRLEIWLAHKLAGHAAGRPARGPRCAHSPWAKIRALFVPGFDHFWDLDLMGESWATPARFAAPPQRNEKPTSSGPRIAQFWGPDLITFGVWI